MEDATYYIKNLLLNHLNLMFLCAMAVTLSAFIIAFCHRCLITEKVIAEATQLKQVVVVEPVLSTFIWMALLFSRAHKEERFMYPIYPLLLFLAIVFLATINTWIKRMTCSSYYGQLLVVSVLVFSAILSSWRIGALYFYYRAPSQMFEELNRLLIDESETAVSHSGLHQY